jgi:hypothetical protein
MSSSSPAEIERFFGNLRYRLDIWEKTKRDIDLRLAGDFNIFDYINPDEPLLSRITADLLDPRGKHGQRSAFLREFVRMLAPAGDYPFEDAIVTCESQTAHIESASRRFDIKIDFTRTFGIVVENKPWAAEQVRQLADYCDQLDREFNGHFLLVYLTRFEEPPQSIPKEDLDRLRDEGRFRHITFQGQFSQWLRRCVKEAQADKLRCFLCDFLDYVDERLSPEDAL